MIQTIDETLRLSREPGYCCYTFVYVCRVCPVVVVVVVVVVVQTAPATAATAVVPMPQVILPAVYIAATIICAIHGFVNVVRVP